MPVQSCRTNNQPGFRWGNKGRCYKYTPGNEVSIQKAKNKAIKQGQAIKSQSKFVPLEGQLMLDFNKK